MVLLHWENTDDLIWVENVLKKNDTFEVENIFILLESSWNGGMYIVYLNKLTISPVISNYLIKSW